MNKQKQFIKDKDLITPEYVEKLKKWILKNQETYFSDKNNKANHWRDFEFFKTIKTDRKHLVLKNEVLLIDREIDSVHCYVICQVYGSVKVSKARCKHIAKVINIDNLNRNYWKNGYFLLPNLIK